MSRDKRITVRQAVSNLREGKGMNTTELMEFFKSTPAGTKVTLIVENMFGQAITMKATTTGVIDQHGYISTTRGAWSLYGGPGWEPCYRVYVRPYRKKRIRSLLIGLSVHDAKLGW